MMTHHDWQKALSMWNEGIDTYSIAWFFHVQESIIYNGLSKVQAQTNEQLGFSSPRNTTNE